MFVTGLYCLLCHVPGIWYSWYDPYIYRITSNLRHIQFFALDLGKKIEKCTYLEFKTHLSYSTGGKCVKCASYNRSNTAYFVLESDTLNCDKFHTGKVSSNWIRLVWAGARKQRTPILNICLNTHLYFQFHIPSG